MTDRRCDHNTGHHDYETTTFSSPLVTIDRVCDACGDTLQNFYANTEGDV